MKILKDIDGNIVKANIIKDIPSGYEDITNIVTNPEKLNEVSSEHLTLQVIPEVIEVEAQAAYWSNGQNIVYNSNDIPTIEDVDGNAILDPAYEKIPAVAYVAPEPQKYLLVKKNGTDEAIATKQIQDTIRSAITFGNHLLVEFSTENVMLGITQDGMTKQVRQVMSEVMAAIQTGSLYDAIDEIDAIPNESKDVKYLTDARLQKYKIKIQEYLGV